MARPRTRSHPRHRAAEVTSLTVLPSVVIHQFVPGDPEQPGDDRVRAQWAVSGTHSREDGLLGQVLGSGDTTADPGQKIAVDTGKRLVEPGGDIGWGPVFGPTRSTSTSVLAIRAAMLMPVSPPHQESREPGPVSVGAARYSFPAVAGEVIDRPPGTASR